VGWCNGGDVTREAVSGGGPGSSAHDWRISIADVNELGHFSTFAGVERIITVMQGQGMTLVIDGAEHALGLYVPLRFQGLAA